MKKIVSMLLIMMLILGMVVGCSTGTSGSTTASPAKTASTASTTAPVATAATATAAANTGNIKIGLMDTLTTTQAISNKWSATGYQLAVKKINDAGGINGRKIEVIVKDTGGDPAITVERMAELKKEGVVAIVGPSSDSLAPAAAQWCEQNKMVAITTGTSSTKVSIDNASRYFFSAGFNAWQIGKLLATNAVQKSNFRTFAFVGTDGAGPNDVYNFFYQEAKKLNKDFTNLGDYRVSTSTTEYSNIVSAIMAAKPDMLVGGIAGPLFISLVKQAQLFNMFKSIDYYGWYTTDASNTQGFAKTYPIGHTHGVITWPFWFDDAESKQFVADYMAMAKSLGYGDLYPADLGYGMYKGFITLAEALKISKDFTGDSIAEAMLKIKVNLPYGKDAYYRDFDHMLITTVWYGDTVWNDAWPVPIAENLVEYGEETYPAKADFVAYAKTKGIDILAKMGIK